MGREMPQVSGASQHRMNRQEAQQIGLEAPPPAGLGLLRVHPDAPVVAGRPPEPPPLQLSPSNTELRTFAHFSYPQGTSGTEEICSIPGERATKGSK